MCVSVQTLHLKMVDKTRNAHSKPAHGYGGNEMPLSPTSLPDLLEELTGEAIVIWTLEATSGAQETNDSTSSYAQSSLNEKCPSLSFMLLCGMKQNSNKSPGC